MRIFSQPPAWAPAVLAATLVLLPACSSPPSSATSGPPGLSTEGVAIAHIDHRYVPAEDFMRISEYFTGNENTGGRVIERTDPAQRAGEYFFVSLEWHPSVTLPAGTQAELDYVLNDDPEPRHAHFVFSQPTGTLTEILLGLTGKEWPNKNLKVAASKVTLKDAAGKILADRQSFLWALPPLPEPVAATPAAPVAAKP